MNPIKPFLIVAGIAGLLLIGSCSNNEANNSNGSSPDTATNNSSDTTQKKKPEAETKTDEHGASQGGEVVEVDGYHLEFIHAKEKEGSHLDLYVQKGDSHQNIPDAKVTAQIQLPDAKQTTLEFKYEAGGKHYTALLNEQATGQYQVKAIVDVNGEKVDGRFSFDR